ncbi:hypothetical protein [Candidatus Binatus sp.]|uniref:hypothetical protein n=1 Tax=Candidatus Binatus sp. TaxID=2811406 RepID=UPI003BAEC5CC
MRVGKIAAGLIVIALVACSARNARALTPEQEQAAQDLRDAEAVSKRHRAELMKIPHVTVVTGEVDSRNEAAILVEVDDQKNIDSVMRQVPSKLDGFPVEVDEGQGDDCDGSGPTINCAHVGHWGGSAPDPPPTIDKNGYYHHAWLKPASPEATPASP